MWARAKTKGGQAFEFAYPIGHLGADDRQSDEHIGRVIHQPSGRFYMLLGRVFDQFDVCSPIN